MRPLTSNRRSTGVDGMSLVELVCTLVLSGIMILGTVEFFSAVSSQVNHPVISFKGPTDAVANNYTLAPVLSDVNDGVAKTDVLDAMLLHMVFSQQIAAADFVAVFGGANIDAGAPAPNQALAMTFANLSLPSLAAKRPRDLLTTQQIAATATEFTGQYDAASGPYDFTVLTIQGINQITTIAQVRRYTTNWNGKAVALYATTMRARALPAGAWTTYAYYFWMPVAEDLWAVPVGAVHYWYRVDTSWWFRNEPTGSALVFPDPFVLAVTSSDSAVKPMSRFSYFVTSSPE